MSEAQQELLFDLLTTKAIYGLNDAERQELDDIDLGTADAEFRSLEITAAAITLVGHTDDESLPAHLFQKSKTML